LFIVSGVNYDFIGETGYVAGWGITNGWKKKSSKLKAAEVEVKSTK
jgi:hypothetical protein